jgi:signal transduction histidine kinase/ligand-binding sensor domain-containing protein
VDLPPDSTSPFLIRSWQAEQGLPHNNVIAITQTPDGYLWLGTTLGLARFDGLNSRVYGLADGLKSLEISTLLEDRSGVLWIGTVGGGLSRLVHSRIQTFAAPGGPKGDAITALLQDHLGQVWVGTTAGLFCWHDNHFTPMAEHLSPLYVRALAEDPQGTVWISTLNEGLMYYTNGTFAMLYGPPGEKYIHAYDLLFDHQGRLWAGLQNGILLCRDQGKWTRYGSADGLPAAYIDHLAQTADGTIWAGTLDEGLYYLKDGKIHALRMPDGLSDDAIASLFVDRQQNLWVGTRSGGLDRLAPRKLQICQIREGTAERLAVCLVQMTNGNMIIGAAGRGLYEWNGTNFEQLLKNPPLSGHLFVGAMLRGRDGSVWWGAGPALYQWKDGVVLSAYDSEDWLRRDRVVSLCEDRDGGMWVGTYNGQLRLLRGQQSIPVTGLPQKPVTALAQAPDGTLWIGLTGGGLGRLQNGQLKFYTTKDGLGNDLVHTLYLDPDGTLWIGNTSGGLSRLSHGKLDNFSTRQGLIDDTILQILDDGHGYLWLSCDRGICRVSKQSLADLAARKTSSVYPLAFGTPEGMISEQCEGNLGSAMQTQDGKLLFCTARGIVMIDPLQQTNQPPPPKVLLEEILVDDQVQNRLLPLAANTHAPQAAPPAISPGRHSLEFHYTGLDFSAPEKIRFRYQLQGLDSDWVNAGSTRSVRYPYVPPGRYRFMVTACNGNGDWNPAIAQAEFIVRPYFWQTPWFGIVSVLALILLTGGAIRYQERRRSQARLRRLEQENIMERERARIARDLHDELGSSLTRISMLSDLGQPHENSSPQLTERIRKISSFAVRTARSLDEIVWAVNPHNDSLRSLLEYLTQFARELFEDANVNCRFYLPEDLPQTPLPPDLRHNIFLAVKEALANALKHSGATQVSLRAEITPSHLILTVEDNGHGFVPGQNPAANTRNGLKNIRQRLESLGGTYQIHSTPGTGTRIILTLPCPTPSTGKSDADS